MTQSSQTEADIIQNRINVALAKSQRLVASWLPPLPDQSDDHKDLTGNDKDDDNAMFTPMPPRLGVGAPLPKEYALAAPGQTNALSREEKLKRNLLKRRANFKCDSSQSSVSRGESLKHGLKGTAPAGSDGSEDDSYGRSSLGKSKRSKGQAESLDDTQLNSIGEGSKHTGSKDHTFLDQALTAHQQRRKRKPKKRGSRRTINTDHESTKPKAG